MIQRVKDSYETNFILLSAQMQNWMDGKMAEILPGSLPASQTQWRRPGMWRSIGSRGRMSGGGDCSAQ